MSSDIIIIASVIARVLFLALFSGSFIWSLFVFSRSVKRVPPPHRIEVFRSVMKRFMVVSWIFLIALTIGGVGSLYTISANTLNVLFSTERGLVVIGEVIATLLFFLNNLLMQFVFLPRLIGVKINTLESPDKALKYFTMDDVSIALRAISGLEALETINLVIGIAAIILGVLFSSPNIDYVALSLFLLGYLVV